MVAEDTLAVRMNYSPFQGFVQIVADDLVAPALRLYASICFVMAIYGCY